MQSGFGEPVPEGRPETPEPSGSGTASGSALDPSGAAGGSSRKSGVKRKREALSAEDYTDQLQRPQTPPDLIRQREEEWQRLMDKRREKHRRRLDLRFHDPDEMVESDTFRLFNDLIDGILDNMDDMDFTIGEEEDDVPSECLITKQTLTDLCREALKLKALGGTHKVGTEKLVKLMTLLEKNMRDATKSGLILAYGKDEDDENETFRDLMNDRILRSADAALTAAAIMTSPSMSKQVYIEDAIERAIKLARFQLTNVIYPAYDLTLRVAQQAKEKGQTPSKPRGRKPNEGPKKNRNVKILYSRMTDLVGCLAELVEMQPLTDNTIINLSPLAVSPFFVEAVSELQLNSLRLAASIFKRYPAHRPQIMGEILSSLHRVPSTKAGKHTYRLNAEEYMGMVTALVLECVQACIAVPSAARPGRTSSSWRRSGRPIERGDDLGSHPPPPPPSSPRRTNSSMTATTAPTPSPPNSSPSSSRNAPPRPRRTIDASSKASWRTSSPPFTSPAGPPPRSCSASSAPSSSATSPTRPST